MSTLQKIAKITQAVLDQVTGADLPTLYYHPHGEIRRVLDYLPQLKKNTVQHRGCPIHMRIFYILI